MDHNSLTNLVWLKVERLTAFKSVKPDLYYAGVKVKDQPVEIGDQLITSRTPADLSKFNQAILAAL